MESRELDLLDRYYKRLERCLEPYKLLRYLSQVGVLDEDDIESIKPLDGERPKRETQVETLLDILKRRENGLKHFIKALLRTKTQDYLARELLEDEHFTESEVTTFIKETESELDETQTLKLLESYKKHENTKHELFEDRSPRKWTMLSDSGCEPDERVGHYDSEFVGRISSGSEPQKDWPLFYRSVDFLNTLGERGAPRGETSSRPINRSASLNFLNNDKLFDQEFQAASVAQGFELEKWPSESEYGTDAIKDSSEEDERERMKELTDKVAKLEQELVRERTVRERSQKEVEMLNLEKEELYEEFDETRYQLSQQDYFDEEGEEYELHFDEEDELQNEISATETQAKYGREGCPTDAQKIPNGFWQFPRGGDPSSEDSSECAGIRSPSDCRSFLASKEYYSLSDLWPSNQLLEQSSRMEPVTRSWVNLNVQHYELDDYNSELEVEQEKTPLSFLETLRKLRLRTNSLYKDAVSEGKDLRMLRDRVKFRGYTPP